MICRGIGTYLAVEERLQLVERDLAISVEIEHSELFGESLLLRVELALLVDSVFGSLDVSESIFESRVDVLFSIAQACP